MTKPGMRTLPTGNLGCKRCGHVVDEDWDICPFCNNDFNELGWRNIP